MRAFLSPEQKAHAQVLATKLSHTLGNAAAAREMRICPTILWKWKHGKSSPTPGNYEKLLFACEKIERRPCS
jgi:hypothetical protein